MISKLEIGNKNDISNLLWLPKNKSVNHLPISTELIQKLKKVNSAGELKIHKRLDKGKFELIIFEISWTESDVPYSPIIIDKSNGKIIGIILPFNEFIGHLTNKENKEISNLGIGWASFVINHRASR